MAGRLFLYTRENCGLCELAAQLLDEAGLEATPVNIEGNLDLLERYGHHIPVLSNGNKELFWPFGLAEIMELTQ